ncbi:TPR-like protein [Daldinia bambusicola]|nr:TPR-like protein [Daldinia bambusicola]
MALCYTIGFGVAKDQAKATDMLALHNIDVSSLDSLVIRCLQQTSISPSISLHKLWRMGHINCIDLSHIYLRQGKLKSAEEHLLREIRDLEATSGKDTTIATALGTELSRLYQVQGRFKEAQDIQEQLVSRHKALFGESHPDTLVSMADLASILCSRGLWKDAEQLQERLLEVTKNNSGGGDFEAICTAFGLASTYLRQGKWLKGGETINAAGDLSRGTFSAGNSLLLQYHALGIISVLEEYQLRGLFYFFHVFIDIVFRKVLGEEHPNVLMLTSLAGLCLAKHERWEEAESWLSHILNAREHLLGKGHPDTLQSMTHLAITLKQRGRLEDAEELQTLAVGRQSKLLGRDHPDTIAGFTSLASIYLDQLRWKEAEDLEVENSKLKEIKLGHCHRETLVSMINLVCIYLNQGRTHEATVQKGQVMERCKASWEKVPYDAWIDIANISLVMSQRGWWEESEGLQRQLLDMSIKEFGECESLTFTSKNLLASTLWRQGRWEEAEEMQKQTVDYGREQSWDEFPVFLDCLDNYNEMKEGLHKGVLKQ